MATITPRTRVTARYTTAHYAPGRPDWREALALTGTPRTLLAQIRELRRRLGACDVAIEIQHPDGVTMLDVEMTVNDAECRAITRRAERELRP